MRPDRAAATLIWIDQGCQRDGAFDGWVKLDTQFTYEIQVGTEPRRHDHLVDDDMASAAAGSGADSKAIPFATDVRDAEVHLHLYLPRCNKCRECCTQFSPGRERVISTAAECLFRIVASKQ